jgi:hypothetical protein
MGWDEMILPIMNHGKGFASLLFLPIAQALTRASLICFMPWFLEGFGHKLSLMY